MTDSLSTMSRGWRRRALLQTALVAALPATRSAWSVQAVPPTRAGSETAADGPMQFPRDHGSHPDFNTEWWYVTGWAQVGERLVGFQVTFFRSRVEAAQQMTSRFAAKQLLFAHAAVTDVQASRSWHDQRIARSGFGVAQASEHDTAVQLRDWSLSRTADGSYRTRIEADAFGLDLRFDATQPVLLQGVGGISRKGPQPDNISHYYSQPQLTVSGRIRIGAQPVLELAPSQGSLKQAAAWLDREWSKGFLHPQAEGWDWIGMNLDDGGALMAFRIRDRAGNALWDGGAYRSASGVLQVFEHEPDTVAAAAPLDERVEPRGLPGRLGNRDTHRRVPHRIPRGQPGTRQQPFDRRDLLGRPVRPERGSQRRTGRPGLSGDDGLCGRAAYLADRPADRVAAAMAGYSRMSALRTSLQHDSSQEVESGATDHLLRLEISAPTRSTGGAMTIDKNDSIRSSRPHADLPQAAAVAQYTRSHRSAGRRRFLAGSLAAGLTGISHAAAPPGAVDRPVPADPAKVPGYPLEDESYGARSQFETEVRQRYKTATPQSSWTFTPLQRQHGHRHALRAALRAQPCRHGGDRSGASTRCSFTASSRRPRKYCDARRQALSIDLAPARSSSARATGSPSGPSRRCRRCRARTA